MINPKDIMAKRSGKGPIMADYDGTWSDSNKVKKVAEAIITGASFEEYNRISKDDKINIPIFFNPAKKDEISVMNIICHKSKIINKTGAKIYYENDPHIAERLKKLCPDCEIKLV